MLSSILTDGLSLTSLAIASGLSLVLGLVIAFVYTRTGSYTKQFATTLVLLPILVQIVMMMVSGNIGTGIAILGAFSLVRFRSIPGSSREIVSVFFAMAIGLATGTGYVGFAILATVLISVVMLVLHLTRAFTEKTTAQTLKITMPEDASHEDALNPVFQAHQVSPQLQSVKTKNMGSLYELTYDIMLPERMDQKQFIDDLRIRNGNLAIVLCQNQAKEGL